MLRPGVDKTAYAILKRMHWSERGWRTGHERVVSDGDWLYAQRAGLVFAPVELDHDDAVQWAIRARDSVTIEQVASGFLASLSTRWLDLRAAIGSLALLLHMPHHRIKKTSAGQCAVCAEFEGKQERDLSAWNFARYMWGSSGAHITVASGAFDLEQFALTFRCTPQIQDYDILRAVLNTASSLGPDERPGDLERSARGLFASNTQERRVLIQILAYCGILQPRGKPSYLESFVDYADREEPREWKVNWSYPASLWRGSDGVNERAVQFWFPDLNWKR